MPSSQREIRHPKASADLGDRPYLLLFAAVLILALYLRLTFFRGILRVDDFNYLRHAAEVWKGRFELGDALFWHATRPLVFVPISLCFALLGVSEASAIAWPLLASLVTVVLVFFIAGELFSRKTALYAMFAAAIFPMLVDESTRVIPGPIINLLAAASAFLFIRSQRAERHRALLLFLSGAAFGLMPWAGRLGLAFGCFFPIAILAFRRQRLLGYWPLATGVLLMFLVDAAYQWIAAGDPFFSNQIAKKILTNEVAQSRPFFYLKLMKSSYLVNGVVLYLAGIAAFIGLLKRKRNVMFLTAWFLGTWVIIEYGSSSFTAYRPLFKLMRFMSILGVPAAILAGSALGGLHGGLFERAVSRSGRVASGLAVALVVSLTMGASIFSLQRLSRYDEPFKAGLDKVRQIVTSYRGSNIYVTHWLWNTRVGFFMDYEDDYFPSGYEPYGAVLVEKADPRSKNRYVQLLSPGEEVEGILIHDEYLFNLKRKPGETSLQGAGEIPRFLADPPAPWKLIERVRIGPRDVVALYKIPRSNWPGNNAGRSGNRCRNGEQRIKKR